MVPPGFSSDAAQAITLVALSTFGVYLSQLKVERPIQDKTIISYFAIRTEKVPYSTRPVHVIVSVRMCQQTK